MKGRVEVIRELLRAKPESIHEKLSRGETVLHLCVKYNRLEALETLLQYLQSYNDMEFLLNSRDDDGNTILHLAAALKQMDTIEYLLGIKNVKDQANIKNKNGSTALDVVEHCPNRDLKTMEIRELLVQAGVRRSICGGPDLNPDSPPDDNYPLPPPQGRCKVLGVIMKWISRFWMTYFNIDPAWLQEVRGHLITAATLTATMAYQAILSPPGSVWTDSGPLNQALPPMSSSFDTTRQPIPDARKEPGAAIMDSYEDPTYAVFTIINTLVLLTSLGTLVLALSGFPVRNKFFLWLLILTMYGTITFVALAYFLVLDIIFPSLRVSYYYQSSAIYGLLYIFFCVIGLVLMLLACHLLVWLWNKFGNLVKRCRTRGRGGGGGANRMTQEKSCCWLP